MSLHVVIISVLLLPLSGSPAAAFSGFTSNPQKSYSLPLIQTGPQERAC